MKLGVIVRDCLDAKQMTFEISTLRYQRCVMQLKMDGTCKPAIRHDKRRFSIRFLVFFLVIHMLAFTVPINAFAAGQGSLSFGTNSVKFAIESNGSIKSLSEIESGYQWSDRAPMAFAEVRANGKSYSVTSLDPRGDLLHATFGASGVEADYKIIAKDHYIIVELANVVGQGIEEFKLLQLKTFRLFNSGNIIAARWNDRFTVCLMALKNSVNSQLEQTNAISSSVYPQFGMQGAKVALIAVPTSQFLEVVREVEKDNALPASTIGGHWSKESPDNRTNYMFTDLCESNADATINYAKMGGLKYILIQRYACSSTLGSYPINTTYYPKGEEGLREVVAKCHAAGLKVGIHMLTALVSKDDSLVHPRPDTRLLKKEEGVLDADLEVGASNTPMKLDVKPAPNDALQKKGQREAVDLQVDDEIVHCDNFIAGRPSVWKNCSRGYANTKVSYHRAGAKVYSLVERYGCYLVDLRTSLKDEVADRVAGIVNRCGFDMIYFDGAEASSGNGPAWYWMGQQEISIWNKIKRDVLIQASGMTHWTWHLVARSACDDYAAIAQLLYLDKRKLVKRNALSQNFLPAELGWCGLLLEAPDHRATLPEEVEQDGMRMLGYDVPLSIETDFNRLKNNGRSEEMLKQLAVLDKLRSSRKVPPQVLARLRAGYWRLTDGGGKMRLSPLYLQTDKLNLPREVEIDNAGPPQPLTLRVRALPSQAKANETGNIPLIRTDNQMELRIPASAPDDSVVASIPLSEPSGRQTSNEYKSKGPGNAPIGRAPIDLQRHRGLAVTLDVKGRTTDGASSWPVLNVQLQSVGTMYRDYYVDVNFSGEKTIIIPGTNVERLFDDLQPMSYGVFNSVYNFDFSKIVSVNFRWMRRPVGDGFSCAVKSVVALAETDNPVNNLRISLGGKSLSIPAEIATGNYVEFTRSGEVRYYDKNGNMLSNVTPRSGMPLTLAAGRNILKLESATTIPVELTIMHLGNAIFETRSSD